MWGSTTLVTLVSRICMIVTSITERVMSHFWAPGRLAHEVIALAQLDGDDRGHPRAQRVGVAELPGLEPDLDGQPLDHLDPVAGGILRRQEREARARAGGERVHLAAEGPVGEGVHAHLRHHAGPDALELG